MLDVAERLIAERGLDAVSLRAVAQEAGQRNNSAAQYHFGSRDGLLRAIIETRSAAVEERRALQVAALQESSRPPTIRALADLFVLPLAASLGPEPTWYLRFLSRLVDAGGMANAPALVRPDGLRYLQRELRGLLPGLSSPTFARRLQWLAEISLRVLADLERDGGADGSPQTQDVVEDLLTMIEALMLAPEPGSVRT